MKELKILNIEKPSLNYYYKDPDKLLEKGYANADYKVTYISRNLFCVTSKVHRN